MRTHQSEKPPRADILRGQTPPIRERKLEGPGSVQGPSIVRSSNYSPPRALTADKVRRPHRVLCNPEVFSVKT